MRFIIPYFAGAISTALIIGAVISSGANPEQLGMGIALAIIITAFAIIACFKRHKRKQKEYYNRFRSKNND